MGTAQKDVTEALSITILPLFRSSSTIVLLRFKAQEELLSRLGLPLFFGLDKCQPPQPTPPPPPPPPQPPANSLISCAPFTERNQQRQRRSYGHHWTSKGFSQKYKILQAPTV